VQRRPRFSFIRIAEQGRDGTQRGQSQSIEPSRARSTAVVCPCCRPLSGVRSSTPASGPRGAFQSVAHPQATIVGSSDLWLQSPKERMRD
jgi:hypothetical protein